MPSYTTVNGATIKNVAVGYETYGTLNAARDNVILVAHFFSGNSHAAGKYAASDAAPGYRDVIIGAGKPSGSILLFPDFSGQAMEILGSRVATCATRRSQTTAATSMAFSPWPKSARRSASS
jgi:homoserine O-acetyltransferase/O-succinyltransferase